MLSARIAQRISTPFVRNAVCVRAMHTPTGSLEEERNPSHPIPQNWMEKGPDGVLRPRSLILERWQEIEEACPNLEGLTGEAREAALSKATLNHFGPPSDFWTKKFDYDALAKKIELDPSKWPKEDREEYEFCPIPKPYSVKHHLYNLKKFRALRINGVPAEEVAAAFDKYQVSIGAATLEWVLPCPPPIHTFEQPPIIKEAPDYE